MSTEIPPTPPSPGVGLRRKGPKTLPRLPLSAFSPPNSGTSERFPLPPSPSTVHPESVVDAHVVLSDEDLTLTQWKKEAGQVLGGRIGGVVLSLPEAGLEKAIAELDSNKNDLILSLLVPFRLEDEEHSATSYLSKSSLPISLSTVYKTSTPQGITSLKWAFEQGRPVDIDVQANISDDAFESFEDFLTKATELPTLPPIILSNILPPPQDLELPIVKLMQHPTYRAFQARTASLSLFPNVYIKFLPPSWNAPTPSSYVESDSLQVEDSEAKLKKEWKRRIKMFLGPIMEAFGYSRIIFGSSPVAASKGISNAGDWYEIAKESLAELGVEQEAIDLVFSETARKVYGSS